MTENVKADKLSRLICESEESKICRLAITQLVETMNEICQKCMADRRMLVLDPLCKNRFYLSLLVESGVPKGEYPIDCYEIRLEEIRKVLAGRPSPVPVKDAVIRLDDFIEILYKVCGLRISRKQLRVADSEKIRELLFKVAEGRKNIALSSSDGKIYVVIKIKGKVMVNLLDLDNKIAYVNLEERMVDLKSVRGLIETLLGMYKLEGNIFSTPTGGLYIRVSPSRNISKEELDDILVGIDYVVGDEDKVIFIKIAEFEKPVVSYSDLITIIGGLGRGEK